MLTRQIAFFAAVLVAVWLTAMGCSRDRVATTELVDVHGTILLDGLPVTDAKVVFVPEGANLSSKYALSYGTTDGRGKFQLKQRDETVGALAGRHRVYVSKRKRDPAKKEGEYQLPGFDDHELSDAEEIPEFYNRHSELEFEVVAGRGILRPEFKLSTVDPLLKRE